MKQRARSTYVPPMIEKIGGFRAVTNGYPGWSYRDLFGGKAFVSPRSGKMES